MRVCCSLVEAEPWAIPENDAMEEFGSGTYGQIDARFGTDYAGGARVQISTALESCSVIMILHTHLSICT